MDSLYCIWYSTDCFRCVVRILLLVIHEGRYLSRFNHGPRPGGLHAMTCPLLGLGLLGLGLESVWGRIVSLGRRVVLDFFESLRVFESSFLELKSVHLCLVIEQTMVLVCPCLTCVSDLRHGRKQCERVDPSFWDPIIPFSADRPEHLESRILASIHTTDWICTGDFQ
jgi:hypothetical protein